MQTKKSIETPQVKRALTTLKHKLNQREPILDQEALEALYDMEGDVEDLLTAQGLDVNFNFLPNLDKLLDKHKNTQEYQPQNKWQREREKQRYYLSMRKQIDKLYNRDSKYTDGTSSLQNLSVSNLSLRK